MKEFNPDDYKELGSRTTTIEIDEYRIKKIPFKITTLYRHRYVCDICGHIGAEGSVYFENPNMEMTKNQHPNRRWGNLSSWSITTSTSSLHSYTEHNELLIIDLIS